jgi:acetoin utilization protein AcuB
VVDPRSLTVRQYMTPDPITLQPEDSLMRALELMRLRSIRRVPLVLDGVFVGLLVEGDLKRAEPSMLTNSQEEFTRVMEETPISRIMIKNPMTIRPDAPLLEAAETLYTTKYGALPVVEGDTLVGILTDNDMMRALVDVLRG